MSLYDRQKTLNLNTNQSILVCGCGGVGYWVAKYASMSGVEKLVLFDPDRIDETNLNRLDVPYSMIGRNKADVTKKMVNVLRPETTVYSMPYKLQESTFIPVDWLIDCTDNIESQESNYDIAKKFSCKFLKAGYNGEHITLASTVASWGEAPNGYTIIPSWVVPASVVAALAVAHVLKYSKSQLSCDLKSLFI
jgi:tRNA A37 threonylcarbamoyladenosine dehydratase